MGIIFLVESLTLQSLLLCILHLDSASLVMSRAEEMQALINFCGLPYFFIFFFPLRNPAIFGLGCFFNTDWNW